VSGWCSHLVRLGLNAQGRIGGISGRKFFFLLALLPSRKLFLILLFAQLFPLPLVETGLSAISDGYLPWSSASRFVRGADVPHVL